MEISLKNRIVAANIAASIVAAGCLLFVQPAIAAETASVEAAFSPHGGAEQLVLRAINESHRSIRVLAYAFTAEPIVRALILVKRRGVDVAVTVDYRENLEEDRSGRARAALAALVYAGVPVTVVRAFPIQHSKYMVLDGKTVETCSYNYTQQAAKYNSENALLLTSSPAVAAQYERNWIDVTALGEPYRTP